jgi:23S rRNA pseudouridine1911/1915/1917 synthase
VSSSIPHKLSVAESDAGERLDRYLAVQLPELSRTRIQELIEAGLVLVDGKSSKGAHRLRAGEKIAVDAQARPPMRAEAENIPLDVLYEDEDVIVLNKAAGMTVHAGAGNPRGTLVNALLGRGQTLSRGGDMLRPGIVHRLDKETSGVILVAKNDFAHANISEAFRQRQVKKTYKGASSLRLGAICTVAPVWQHSKRSLGALFERACSAVAHARLARIGVRLRKSMGRR